MTDYLESIPFDSDDGSVNAKLFAWMNDVMRRCVEMVIQQEGDEAVLGYPSIAYSRGRVWMAYTVNGKRVKYAIFDPKRLD